MKYRSLLCTILFLICLVLIGTAQNVDQNFVDGRLHFQIEPSADFDPVTDLVLFSLEGSAYSVKRLVKSPSGMFRFLYKLEFDPSKELRLVVEELEQNSAIKLVERVPVFQYHLAPNDSLYQSNQWYFGNIFAEGAWDIGLGDSNVTIAILDDAVEITHPDLWTSSLWVNGDEVPNNGIDDDNNGYIDDVYGVNAAAGTGDPMPGTPISSFQHGTHVAGIACATTNNVTGVAALGHGVKLMSVRVSNANAMATGLFEGIAYAIDNGADIISMSMGNTFYSQLYQDAIDYADSLGIIVIASAGNDGVDTKLYPAAYDHVICVAASNSVYGKWALSNYDDGTGWVDISAPGTGIHSLRPVSVGSYSNLSGTSMSTPMVAGLCGLMLSQDPTLTPGEIENCIKSTATPATLAFSSLMGAGVINAEAAMQCILGMNTNTLEENNATSHSYWYDYISHHLVFNWNERNNTAFNIVVTNSIGQVVTNTTMTTNTTYLPLQNLKPGIYIVRLSSKSGFQSIKFVKSR
ncbi:MAG TPA: T9SS type A sorting domain-containing protein [Flavobacteriales bacterium]|nr:T9SS type A sorting domain-containing protein [Flavobacteriales bacterium]